MTSPLLVSGRSDIWDFAKVVGVVTFENGCPLLDGLPVVWPEGTSWDPEAEEMVLANGERVATGEEVTGVGGYYDVDRLRAAISDEGVEIASNCSVPTGRVAFFNPGSEVSRVD